MPEPAEFLRGFGLVEGKTFDGYILSSAYASHQSIKRYQEYKYDIILVFKNKGKGDYHSLYHTLSDIVSQSHIIYGVRNPYRCTIDSILDGNISGDEKTELTIKLQGHSYRSN